MTNFEVITKDVETLAAAVVTGCPPTMNRLCGRLSPSANPTFVCRKCWAEWLNKESEEKKDA